MNVPEDMLHPGHYANVRRPQGEAECLPPWCYTSEAFHRLEVERIFMKTWNFAGRADQVPNPGDYAALELAGAPILIVRDSAGAVRAFANSCRHRGSQLLSGEGNCRAIVCPYHGWVYDLEGNLKGAPQMQEVRGFHAEGNGLLPLRLETWQDFLFVNFDPEAEGLTAYLGDLPGRLESYNFPELVTTRRKVWEVVCNWKVYLENQRESYHVPTVHRESLGSQTTRQLDAQGNWSGSLISVKETAAVMPGDSSPFPRIVTLSGDAAEGSHFFALYPNTYFVCTVDCFWWMECRPRGPGHTTVVVGSGFPKETVAREDFEQVVQLYYKRWDTTHPEDNRACELQQLGLNSPHARAGRLAPTEKGVHAVDNWVLDRLLEG